jgi:hypothetical protein
MSINKLQLKRSAVVGKVPTTASLDLGELAINTVDGKIYFKQQDTGSVQRILELTSTSGSHLSASYAQTASYSDRFTVGGTLTAQTLIVQTVSSSIIYSSGSNTFGNSLANNQRFTGSVDITGSLTVNGRNYLTDSGSFDTRIRYISSSFEAATASLNAFSSSILSYTASNNATIADILIETASLNAATASLNRFSSSILNFTASQKNSNGTFATTGSNTFYGTETITGSIALTGSAFITGSVNVYGGGFNVNGVNVLDTALAYAIALG